MRSLTRIGSAVGQWSRSLGFYVGIGVGIGVSDFYEPFITIGYFIDVWVLPGPPTFCSPTFAGVREHRITPKIQSLLLANDLGRAPVRMSYHH